MHDDGLFYSCFLLKKEPSENAEAWSYEQKWHQTSPSGVGSGTNGSAQSERDQEWGGGPTASGKHPWLVWKKAC